MYTAKDIEQARTILGVTELSTKSEFKKAYRTAALKAHPDKNSTSDAKEKMQKLLARFDMSSVTSHITAGPPDRTIPHQANELNSDLVIIGSVGREGVIGFLLGNTAEKVLHHLRTDCLIIKQAKD